MLSDKNSGLRIILIYLLKLFAFWMLLFVVMRCCFLALNFKDLKEIPVGQVLLSFWNALRMDVASACYLLVLPLILICIGMVSNKSRMFLKAVKWINYILIGFYLIISFAGMGLYANWGTKVNSKALSFMIYPQEMAGIIFDVYNLLYFGILLAFLALVIFLYNHFIKTTVTSSQGVFRSLIFFLVFTGLLFIGARGGLQKYPLNKSSCFYSKYPVLNFAALNDFWNFSSILTSPQVKKNPYLFYDEAVAEKTFNELFSVKKDSTEYVLTTSRPNIVLIALESFSADAIACLGGEKGIAPLFDSLAKEGLLFTDAYATGFRTDQGIVALLSGFPAQPRTSIIKNFEKFDKLPNLMTTMNKSGYCTSFYYGGDLNYANTKTYLQMAGTDILVGGNDIPHNRQTDWGVYDEDVFSYHLNALKKMQQPFFSVMLSLTNHEYFVADVEKVFPEKTENDLFHNTAHYTDKCLYNYLQQAKKTSWFPNTLFIITADHAHKHPLERAYNEPARHHIPLLFYGGALKDEYKGKKFGKTTSQVDIAPIILSQLQIKNNEFAWSKNVLNKYAQGFAFYTFDDGFGFVTDSSELVYDHNLKSVIRNNNKIEGSNPEKSLKQGKSFLQLLFQKYIEL